jgi:mannose-6-phosphate isomerase-like protein (cupin superfamily)
MKRVWLSCTIIQLILTAGIAFAENPPRFALRSQAVFTEHKNFHGGAGAISYADYFKPEDYKTQHYFLRVVTIPSKAGIGEYRLTDSDETFALYEGRLYVTVDGKTGHLAGKTLVPVKMGSSVGMYNPSDAPATVIWVCSVKERGKYSPVDLGNDLAQKRPEGVIPFPHIAQNYYATPPGKTGSHLGAGQGLIENVEVVNFGYFETGYHTRWFAVPPKSSIGYHTHFTNEEHFFVVSGTALGTVNDVTVRMGPLDTLICGVNDRHGIYNDGTEPLWLFFTNQPGPGITGWGKVDNNGDNLADHKTNWPK